MPDKRRLTFGRQGTFTHFEARNRARFLLADVAKGFDITRNPKTDLTFGQAIEQYMLNSGRGNRTREANRRLVELDVTPERGSRPISEISQSDTARLSDKIANRSPSVARAVFAAIRPMFGWRSERGLVAHNPIANLRPPVKIKSRIRILTDIELVQI